MNCARSQTHRGVNASKDDEYAVAATTTLAALHAGFAAPPKPENVLSPEAALDRLMKGNARYVDGVSRRHDFKNEREVLSGGQTRSLPF